MQGSVAVGVSGTESSATSDSVSSITGGAVSSITGGVFALNSNSYVDLDKILDVSDTEEECTPKGMAEIVVFVEGASGDSLNAWKGALVGVGKCFWWGC